MKLLIKSPQFFPPIFNWACTNPFLYNVSSDSPQFQSLLNEHKSPLLKNSVAVQKRFKLYCHSFGWLGKLIWLLLALCQFIWYLSKTGFSFTRLKLGRDCRITIFPIGRMISTFKINPNAEIIIYLPPESSSNTCSKH